MEEESVRQSSELRLVAWTSYVAHSLAHFVPPSSSSFGHHKIERTVTFDLPETIERQQDDGRKGEEHGMIWWWYDDRWSMMIIKDTLEELNEWWWSSSQWCCMCHHSSSSATSSSRQEERTRKLLRGGHTILRFLDQYYLMAVDDFLVSRLVATFYINDDGKQTSSSVPPVDDSPRKNSVEVTLLIRNLYPGPSP